MTANNVLHAPLDSATIITDFTRQVYCVLGLPFDALDTAGAVKLLLSRVDNSERCFFSTPNLNFLIGSLQDPAFRDSVMRSNLSLADGMPVVWLARLLGIPISSRVAGATVFEQLRSQRSPLKVFFFGGPDGVAQRAAEIVNGSEGSMRCVGAYSPGFGTLADMSTPVIIEQINASGADLLVVALGAKRGQAWIEHNLDALRTPLVSHLGAVVNFVAGTVTRAPAGVGRLGLEWLWRIKEEPALWRRYWHDGIALARLLVTRVLPSALATHRARSAVTAPVLYEHDDGYQYVLTLDGAWEDDTLRELRVALARSTAEPRQIRLELLHNCSLDSAALGLLLLLYGHQSRVGAALTVHAQSNTVRRIMRLHNVDFMLKGLARPAMVSPGDSTVSDLATSR